MPAPARPATPTQPSSFFLPLDPSTLDMPRGWRWAKDVQLRRGPHSGVLDAVPRPNASPKHVAPATRH
jgi:hypothetical protein